MADTAVVFGTLAQAALPGRVTFVLAVMAPLIPAQLDAATAARFVRSAFTWRYLVVLFLFALVAA